jgi:hypothetical protein
MAGLTLVAANKLQYSKMADFPGLAAKDTGVP